MAKQSRDFTFVANVVAANLLACEQDGRIAGVYKHCVRRHHVDPGPHRGPERGRWAHRSNRSFLSPRTGDIRASYADIGKARAVLAYEPVVSIRKGLKHTAAWYTR